MHQNYYAKLQSQTLQQSAQQTVQQDNQQYNPQVNQNAMSNPFAAAAIRQNQQAQSVATSPFGAPIQQNVAQQQQNPFPQNVNQQQTPQTAGQNQVQQQQVVQEEEIFIDYTLFNTDKSLLRCTTDRIPFHSQLFKDSQLPFGIIVKPFGDMPNGEEVPAVSFKNDPIVRCKDCRAYINPFVRWLENGQKWICPFCGDINVTESYYYSTIEEDGYRTDHDSRPEFSCGTVDFVANHEYMNRPPMPPTYIFAFDVSKPAVDSGYLAHACSTIKSVIEQELLPGMSSERVKIAFLSYDNNVQFYNLKPILKQPQMLVMTDPENFFMPQPEDLLVNLQESYDLIINLLDNMPSYFSKSTTAESSFITALQCANNIIKVIGGKMIFFQVSHMILRHPKLQPAQPQTALKQGAERIDLWQSTNSFFKNTGIELAHTQISFDLFSFSYGQKQLYKNIKTFSDISAHSSGNLYYYPEFNSRQQGLKFSNELYHNLSRKNAWEAVFRIRLSQGFNQIDSYGNIQIKAKTTDLVLAPTIDSDRVFMYEFEKANEETQVDQSGRLNRISKRFLFVQSALLYSSSEGQRRIRCHNIAIPIVQSAQEAFDYLDITALSAMLTRKALNRFQKLQNKEASKQVIDSSLNNMVRSLQRYAKLQKGEQFQLSENMQYFKMYAMGIIKSPIVNLPVIMNQGDTIDKLVYQKFLANMMSPEEILPMYSPQIISISNRELNDQEYPPLEVLERSSIRSDSIYLLYNAMAIYMFIGRHSDPFFIYEIFRVNDISQIDKGISEEEIFQDVAESPYLNSLYNIINQIRYQRQPFCEIQIILDGEVETEKIVKSLCIID